MSVALTVVWVWVFAVDVSEMWTVPWGAEPFVERQVGGWTHNGPYKTKAECENARNEMLRKPYAYKDDAHIRWDRPRECRREDAAKVKALREAELRMLRRGF